MDGDGLLAGAPGSAAHLDGRKVGDWVVTPRVGKPVEIQALWINALRLASDLKHPPRGELAARASTTPTCFHAHA